MLLGPRRIGRPGLLGTVARTAVITGTAAATANAVNRRQQSRQMQQAEAAAYEASQVPPQAAPVAAPPPAPEATESLGDQLQKIAALHEQGILSDSEFAEAKRRLLG